MSIDFPPAYPLNEIMGWGLYHTMFERGSEQDVPGACYPYREWDLTYYSNVESSDVGALRDFLNRQQKDSKVFLFMEPYRTTRMHVRIGHGDGIQGSWVVPVFDASSLTFYVNSLSVGYSVSTGTGVASLGVVTISAPAPTEVVTFSFIDGFYVPMVCIRDVFQYTHEGPEYGTIKFSLRELKLDYPEA